MSLSCSCDEWDGDGWAYISPNDFTILDTKRSRRCCSCKALIRPGDACTKYERLRYPVPDSIEERIVGEEAEIYLAPWFMCEKCGGIAFSLEELGFCVSPASNMMNDLAEYHGLVEYEKARKREAGRVRGEMSLSPEEHK